MNQSMQRNLFLNGHFVHTYTHNSKTTCHIWMFYILNGCSSIGHVYFLCQSQMRDMIGELWLKMLISLFDKLFVHTYTHNLKTTGHIWTFCTSDDCITFGVIPCVPQSCMRDPTGELCLQTHISCSLIQHRVCTLQACAYSAIWYATMHYNKTHVPHDYILPTKLRLYCQQHINLQEQSWLATLHVTLSFQLIVQVNIEITKRYYHIYLLRVCC